MEIKLYKFTRPGLITVCMVCSPGRSVLDQCPELPADVQISHGICTAHRRAWLLDLGIDPDKEPAPASV